MKLYEAKYDPIDLIDSDYNSAVVRMAWDWARGGSKLIFAVFELIPSGFPDLETIENIKPRRLTSSSNHNFCFKQFTLTTKEFLQLYLNCCKSKSICFDEKGKVTYSSNPKIKISLPHLSEEPTWPELSLVTEETLKHVPFITYWHRYPKLHHLISRESVFSFNEKEKAKFEELFNKYFFFDISDFPEFLGSINLVLPDPVFKNIDFRLDVDDDNKSKESILFNFDLRPNQNLKELELNISENRKNGKVLLARTQIDNKTIKLQIDRPISTINVSVMCNKRGFLYSNDFIPFGRKLVISGNLVTGTRRVSHPSCQYEIQMRGDGFESTIGEINRSTAIETIENSQYFREQTAKRKKYFQKWFKGQEKDAEDFIRAILEKSSRKVVFIDPYFNDPKELFRFALAVPNYRVPVTIFTSAEQLKKTLHVKLKKYNSLNNLIFNFKQILIKPKTMGLVLHEEIGRLKALHQSTLNPITVKVMPGKHSPIHDRFLIIDDDILHIGSSFNNLGKRGTLICMIPVPEYVLNDIEIELKKSQELEAYLKKRNEL